MPIGLHRTYGAHHLHFITNTCYQRRPLLNTPRARDCFLSVLEQTREKYRFVVVGCVVMPEHVHLLITEPEVGNPSTVMQVLKQRTGHALLPKRKRKDPRQGKLFTAEEHRAFWQARFYDFNVWTTKKRLEKLRYMHRNPVKRGLVQSPEQWRWSSYRHYLLDEAGPVQVNVGCGKNLVPKSGRIKIKLKPLGSAASYRPLQKTQERGTHFVVVSADRTAGHPPHASVSDVRNLRRWHCSAMLCGDDEIHKPIT